METRNAKIAISKSGGNASAGALKYSLTIPNTWAQSLNIKEDNREVKIIRYDFERFIIINRSKDSVFAANIDEKKLMELEKELKLHNMSNSDFFQKNIDSFINNLKNTKKIKKTTLARIFEDFEIDSFNNALDALDYSSEQSEYDIEDEYIYIDFAFDFLTGTMDRWSFNLSEEEFHKKIDENENFQQDLEEEIKKVIEAKSELISKKKKG